MTLARCASDAPASTFDLARSEPIQDVAEADLAPVPCFGALVSATADGCCPDAPGDRGGDPDCTVAGGAFVADTVASSAAVDGRVFLVVRDGGALWLRGFDAALKSAGQIALADGQLLPPVVLPNGDVAAISGDSIVVAAKGAITAASKSSTHTGHGPLASAVTARPGGGLLAVTFKGAIVELDPASGAVTASKDGLLATGAPAHTALWAAADEQVYWVAIGGVLHGVRLDSVSVFGTAPAALSAPALGRDGAVYFASKDGLTGLGADHHEALVVFKAGDGLFDPVVGADDVVVVASAGSKRVTAVRLLSTGAEVRWQTAVLPSAPATPPLLLAGGDVALGLTDGTLVGIRPEGLTAAVVWRHSLEGAAVSAPLAWPDGTALHMTGAGVFARVVAGLPGTVEPWPRVRRDLGASSVLVEN